MPTDIWVPHGNKFRTDASSFITRNGTDDTLTFEATAANGSKILDCRCNVTDETYVVHFMTAGTRPTQSKFGYCPHARPHPPRRPRRGRSRADAPAARAHQRRPRPAVAPAAAGTHVVRSRGVHWTIGAEGQMRARAAA